MYQAIHYERRKNKIHIWDDKSGHLVVPYKKYAYIKNSSGQHFTLDGDKVKKIYKWEEGTPGLFESTDCGGSQLTGLLFKCRNNASVYGCISSTNSF